MSYQVRSASVQVHIDVTSLFLSLVLWGVSHLLVGLAAQLAAGQGRRGEGDGDGTGGCDQSQGGTMVSAWLSVNMASC